MYGVLLAHLMQPSRAVLDAVRWALQTNDGGGGARAGRRLIERSGSGSGGRKLSGAGRWGAGVPQLALHMRAMSDFRAKNLTIQVSRDGRVRGRDTM